MSSKTKTTTMRDVARLALVPKLRFPEFLETAAWESTKIGALGHFYYGKSAPKWSLAADASTPCVRYGELYTKFGPVITETHSRTNIDPETLKFSKGGEILIPRVGEKPEDFGKCCAYLPLEGIAIGEMISVLETKQHPLFYTYYFRNLYKQFAKVVEGQNVKNLYFTELEPLPICRPSIPEQQKIADCLGSLDELIAAQARKVDALKTHKKGLMQELFPREWETQPRLRFPEFQDFGEWERRKAGNLFGNRTVKGKDGLPIYSVTMNDGMVKRNSLDRKVDDIEDAAGNKKVLKNDIAYNMMRMWQGALGVAPEDCLVSPAYVVLTPKKDTVPLFFQYMFKLPEMLLLLTAHSRGLTKDRLRLYFDDFARMEFRCPNSKEQERIASYLGSLDALITAETQKLETLKTHKKGLMQQIFPSAEEA
jgi:type I restriction enzyme, S subunit